MQLIEVKSALQLATLIPAVEFTFPVLHHIERQYQEHSLEFVFQSGIAEKE